MFQTFADYDIRYYTYETLKVLVTFCYSVPACSVAQDETSKL